VNEFLFDLSPTPLPAWAKKLAVFDLETTGLDLKDARIVTACAAVIDENGEVIGEDVEWLADPVVEIPEIAASVDGITTEYARAHGRPAAEVVAEIVERLRGYFESGIPVVAYNAPYDFTILHFEALRHGIKPLENPGPVIDPLVIDKFLDRYRGGKRRLELTAAFYNVALTDAHNATADAVAAGKVAQAIARKYFERLDIPAAQLHSLQVGWSKDLDLDFERFMQGKDPSFKTQLGWPLKFQSE
jgi:DNA polymerase-3 subunit epsilon